MWFEVDLFKECKIEIYIINSRKERERKKYKVEIGMELFGNCGNWPLATKMTTHT